MLFYKASGREGGFILIPGRTDHFEDTTGSKAVRDELLSQTG
jgi:hypothetical protein